MPWTPQPWRMSEGIGAGTIDQLYGRTGSRAVSAIGRHVFTKLATDPFTNQFFCWAQQEMPFQSYMAWPVKDALQCPCKTSAPTGLAADESDFGTAGPFPADLVVAPIAEISWNKSPVDGAVSFGWPRQRTGTICWRDFSPWKIENDPRAGGVYGASSRIEAILSITIGS